MFGIDQKIEISAFGIGDTALVHKFGKLCSKLKYSKRIPACSTCKITNRNFGFIDKHAHVDAEMK